MNLSLATLLPLLLIPIGFFVGLALRHTNKAEPYRALRQHACTLAMRSLPVSVFCAAARMDFTRHGPTEIATHGALVTAVFVLCAGFIALLSPRLGCDRPTTVALALAAGCASTGMFGFPATAMLHGEDALAIAAVRDQVNFALLVIAMPLAALWTRGRMGTLGSLALQVVARLLRFPPLVALTFGLVVAAWGGPSAEAWHPWLRTIGDVALAACCFAGAVLLGLITDLGTLKHQRAAVALSLITKLAVAPLAAVVACRLLTLDAEPVTQMAMPTLLAVALLSEREDLRPELSAAVVTLGSVLVPLTFPLVHLIAERAL